MKAKWNNTVIAESKETIEIEGNHYFPHADIKKEYFSASDLHTSCPWKGIASYYTIVVGEQSNKDAAWYYPDPKEAAARIKGYVAFWKGVEIVSK